MLEGSEMSRFLKKHLVNLIFGLLPIGMFCLLYFGKFQYEPKIRDFPKDVCNKVKLGNDSLTWNDKLHLCGREHDIKKTIDDINNLNTSLDKLKKENAVMQNELQYNYRIMRESIDSLIRLVNDLDVKMNKISRKCSSKDGQ